MRSLQFQAEQDIVTMTENLPETIEREKVPLLTVWDIAIYPVEEGSAKPSSLPHGS